MHVWMADSSCPITMTPLDEIDLPVIFCAAPEMPYEASALARWLVVRRVVPHTNTPCEWSITVAEIITPLPGCRSPKRAMDTMLRIVPVRLTFHFTCDNYVI